MAQTRERGHVRGGPRHTQRTAPPRSVTRETEIHEVNSRPQVAESDRKRRGLPRLQSTAPEEKIPSCVLKASRMPLTVPHVEHASWRHLMR